MKISFVIVHVIICFMFFQASSQGNIETNIIRGRITDANTQKPIPHVEVFISGTTIGCISNKNGDYELKVPFLPCTLVADHVSYESFITVLQHCKNSLNISLTPGNISIQEVQVSSKSKRKRNLRYFYSRFIQENKNKIEILNDSVLIFTRNDMDFKASTNEPLVIINRMLGYKIKLLLEEFHVYSVDSPNGKRVPLNSMKGGDIIQLTGYYYYEELANVSQDKKNVFNYNRRLNYYGSHRHFLKAIYDNETDKQGFQIVTVPANSKSSFVEMETDNTFGYSKKFRIEADTLRIFYHFDDNKYPVSKDEVEGRNYVHRRESTIYASNEPFIIRSNGTSPKLSFIVNGLMSIKSFANSLPENYVPPKK